jgi:DNA (cytosine-5)-methyltransferase 1
VTDRFYVSLFAGAGGVDLGLTRAGLRPALVTDADPYACATLRAALPGAPVMESDIHDMINSGVLEQSLGKTVPYSLVAGMPPVVRGKVYGKQDISADDDAPQLFYRFLDVVAQARPDAFILFGIPALTSKRWAPVAGRIRTTARSLGYDMFSPVLDAGDYGVPQRRDRLALIGMPAGCRPKVTAAPKKTRVTAGAVLRALPKTRDIACPSGIYLSTEPVLRDSPYSGQLLSGLGRVLDLRKTAPVIPADLGGNKTPVLDLDQLETGAVPWIEDYHRHLWADHGDPYSEFPAEARMRRLSLRECAALQGFPPAYPFFGPAGGQFRQCGTAVPPPLAEAAARAVMAGLS